MTVTDINNDTVIAIGQAVMIFSALGLFVLIVVSVRMLVRMDRREKRDRAAAGAALGLRNP